MTELKVLAIIQGRTGSSRLPGKVLRQIGTEPMLGRVITRVSRARTVDQVVVATTVDPGDDPIASFCQERSIPCFRGNVFDVLDRYYQAALHFGADAIVRVTADCPMIDPVEIDRVVNVYLEGGYDFVTNRLPPPSTRTSPIGMDVEVCGMDALTLAWQNASEGFEREHVMPYLYDKPGRFRVKVVEREPSLGHLRFTVDTPEDLALANAIYAAFDNRDDFSLVELLEMNARHPEWQAGVAQVRHKHLYEVDTRAQSASQSLEAEAPRVITTGQPKTTHSCPLCGQPTARVFHELNSFGFTTRYYQCHACGFVFQDAAESQAANPDFYAETYRKIYQDSPEPTAKDLRQQSLRAVDQLNYLRQTGIPAPRRILDVGASSGLLLEHLRDGFHAEVVGVEPGDAYRAIAAGKGLRMAASLEQLLAEKPARFDMVTLMHVLEHLNEPLKTLVLIRERLLENDGHLFVEVPNLYAHDSFELAHLGAFSRHSLTEMLRQAGYDVVASRAHGYPRSNTLKLYIAALAVPTRTPGALKPVRREKHVALKRNLGMFWRKLLTRLLPRATWLPLED